MMHKIIRRGLFTILVLASVFVVLITISAYLSPRTAGQSITEKLGIPYPAVVAHRGASWDAPEETRAAYLLARELGADYLEADVQRTKDGVLIALHDDSLMRTTNISEVFPERKTLYVEHFNFAELQQLDAGSWFNKANPDRARESFKNLKIIKIEELLDIAEGGVHKPGIYLETKAASRFPGIEKQLVTLLERRGWILSESEHQTLPAISIPVGKQPVQTALGKGRVILQSFEKESLTKLKELAPHVPRMYLISSEMANAEGLDTLLNRASELGHGVGPVGYLGMPWNTGRMHARGLGIHFYTIKYNYQMQLLGFFGADGFFTDRVDLTLKYYGRRKKVNLEEYFNKIGY